jgi:hypothetical protein
MFSSDKWYVTGLNDSKHQENSPGAELNETWDAFLYQQRSMLSLCSVLLAVYKLQGLLTITGLFQYNTLKSCISQDKWILHDGQSSEIK